MCGLFLPDGTTCLRTEIAPQGMSEAEVNRAAGPPSSRNAKGVDLPQRDSWQEAWQLAAELTVEELQRADLEVRCASSGAVWRPEEEAVEIPFMGRAYRIGLPAFEVVLPESDEEVPLTAKILILHYLNNAGGARPSGEWITFAQVPGGEMYLPNFQARSVDRLVRTFDGREAMLVEASRSLGGVAADYGDASVQLQALPRVPLAVTLWRGDDEFPPSGNLLFDATVTDYLSTEDMVMLAGMVASRLCS